MTTRVSWNDVRNQQGKATRFFSVNELQQQGILNQEIMFFIWSPPPNINTEFTPFSSEDPLTRTVLEIKIPDRRVWVLNKKSILIGPPPAAGSETEKQL